MRSLSVISATVLALGICSVAVPDELSLRTTKTKNKLLVLNNGNVVGGQLTPRPGGFDVALNPGRMFIADSQIRFQANSMEDAYLKMRASIQDLTPANHIELSRWCSANKLPTFARKELLDALFLNPDHTTARLMLERMTRDESRERQRLAPSAKTIDQQKLAEDIALRNALPERRSLGGLPQQLAVTFTRRIQPTLSNKCGNARCHSPGRNDFAIVSIRNGSSAVISEQNLAAVLNQLDFANSDNSPLLTETSGLHGGSRNLLFPGPSGRLQRTQLREWIAEVVKEIGGERPTTTESSSTAVAEIVQTAWDSGGAKSADVSQDELLTATHGTRRNRQKANQELTEVAVIATRHDKFDPDVFNRRFHGRSDPNKSVMKPTR